MPEILKKKHTKLGEHQQWGSELLVPILINTAQETMIIMTIDYLSKWIEAKALASATESKSTNSYGSTCYPSTNSLRSALAITYLIFVGDN